MDPESDPPFMNKLVVAIRRQIELNKTKNMLYARLGQVIEIDPTFLVVLEELVAKDAETMSDLALQDAVSFASKTLINRLYSINQFLQIEEEKAHDLESIYLHTWKKIIATKDIHSTLKNYHYPALARWIASLYPKHFVKRLQWLPTVGHLVCGEYSPEFQIELLRIDLRALKQPLLDIGCGTSAGLVRYLRALGIEAHGFDRHIEEGGPHLQQSDWFDYRFEPYAWGTITSNMAFTNHFLYAYHHDNTQLCLYARKFNEIIESLMIGGSFHYAPSISFIEHSLEASKYQVERFAVVKDISMTRIRKVAK